MQLPNFLVDNAHLMYNVHPNLFWHSFWLHLIYLSYLSNVYCACSFFTNLDLFCSRKGMHRHSISFWLQIHAQTKHCEQAHCQGETYLMQWDWLIALQWMQWNSQNFSNFTNSYSSTVEDKFLHLTDTFICSICWWLPWAFSTFNREQATCNNQNTIQNLMFFSLSIPQKLLSTMWKLL
jgi:hypothetical protein